MKAFLMSGRMSDVYLKADLKETSSLGARWYPELDSGDISARELVVPNWTPISMWFVAPDDGRRPRFTDAVGYGAIRGIGTFVSARARDVLAPVVASECHFLPVEVRDAPTRYYAMYVTRLLDCLDVARSRFGRPPTNLPAPISVPRLIDSRVSGFLFRLVGGCGYQFDYDFATERFVELSRSLGLSGFRYREDLASRWIES